MNIPNLLLRFIGTITKQHKSVSVSVDQNLSAWLHANICEEGLITVPIHQAETLMNLAARAQRNHQTEKLTVLEIAKAVKMAEVSIPFETNDGIFRWLDGWNIAPVNFGKWYSNGGTEWMIIDGCGCAAADGEYYYYDSEMWFITLNQGDTDGPEEDQLFVQAVRAVLQYLTDREQNPPLSAREFDILSQQKSKAAKWDALAEKIAEYYSDEHKDGDGLLLDIGEHAASAFGWM